MKECFLCEEEAIWYDSMQGMYLCNDCKELRIEMQYERIEEIEQ